MRKILFGLLSVVFCFTASYAQVASNNVVIQEQDGSPKGILRILNTTAGTLTNQGGGKWKLGIGAGGGNISNVDYAASWENINDTAPSKNVVWKKIETLGGGHDPVTTENTTSIIINLAGQKINATLDSTLKSNYDTAYGWGNHASAGYGTSNYTSNQATNTTSSVVFADVNVTSGAYGAGWNGNKTTPNRDDVYDKINAIVEFPGNSSILPEWANVQNKTAVLTTSSSWSGGDLGGTGLAPSVTDDSHLHTSLSVKQYNQTKGFAYYNITNSSDFLIPPLPIAINLNKVTAYCQGGTNVTFMLEECNATGGACVGVNSTAWIAVNNTELEIVNFSDGAIDAGDHMKCNVTQEGNPTFFTLGWDYSQQ